MKASEVNAAFMSPKSALIDRKLFVSNLGDLLSQTRERIVSAHLDDNEIVHVVGKGGQELKVNVSMDSYFAIIKDVIRAVDQW